MSAQVIKKDKMDQKELMNAQLAIEISALVQKLGKSKRKHSIKLQSNDRKLMKNLIKEMRKNLTIGHEVTIKNFNGFLDYLESELKAKKDVKLSYDEILFLRKLLQISLKQMDVTSFKWYQIIKKLFVRILISQYKLLLKSLNV